MKKLIFFLFFLLTPTQLFAVTDTNCEKKFSLTKEYDSHQNIDYLEVKFENNRDWLVNSLKIGIGNFRFIPDSYKRNFKGEIIVHYKNKSKCSHKARIRFSGDMKDHVEIDLTNNKITQSIDVKLNEGNILGITNFKLLLPKTRGDDEIFVSELLKSFGYLAPRTYLTNVKLNDQDLKMIFQEKNRKELLELNKRRETVLLEGDERFIFLKSQNIPLDNKSNHAAGLVPLLKDGFRIMLAKQKNSNLILRNESLEHMSINALTNLNKIYLKYSNNFDRNSNYLESYRFYTLDNELLGFNNKKNTLFLDVYNLIVMASSDGHSLMPSNRQFYWNSFNHFFEPVSYDGNFKIFNNANHLIEPLSNNFNESFDEFYRLLENLDQFDFNKKINEKGISQTLNETQEKLKKLKLNVDSLKIKFENFQEKKKFEDGNSQNNLKNYVKNLKKIDKNIQIVRLNSDNDYLSCDNLESCKIIQLTKPEIGSLLRAELEINGKPIQFMGKIIENENFIENYNFKKQMFGSTLILYDKNIKIDLNSDLNQIDIFQLKKNAKIVFLGGYLEDLKINFNGVNPKNLSKKLELNPIDINGLTGCLSFINMKISNIKLAAKESSCEDSINLINTSGQIDEIIIENSLSDGLDIDFSELKIGFIDIKNSKNDCADFSFGNYEINKLQLNNCGDKGVSVGEKSLFKSDKIIVKNSNIGIASKDSSEVYLKDITIDKVETCLSAYNKKQEFLGGFIKATNLDCQKFKNFTNKDEMSEIIINKKILQSNLKKQNFFN